MQTTTAQPAHRGQPLRHRSHRRSLAPAHAHAGRTNADTGIPAKFLCKSSRIHSVHVECGVLSRHDHGCPRSGVPTDRSSSVGWRSGVPTNARGPRQQVFFAGVRTGPLSWGGDLAFETWETRRIRPPSSCASAASRRTHSSCPRLVIHHIPVDIPPMRLYTC
jgi:hypothetical protein